MKKRLLLFRVLLALAIMTIFSLATTSTDIPVVEDLNDKASHTLAFLALSFLVVLSWPDNGLGAAKILGLLGYGLAIEVVQFFLPHRTFSFFDLFADGAGIVICSIILAVLAKRKPEGAE